MPRIARIVVPGLPHHVTQRGNRRMQTFFCDEDYQEYLALLAHWCGRHGNRIWAYCLMPNHVHLIVVPETADGLRGGVGEAHRRYSRRINFREGWRGHLWQGRFASFVMDQPTADWPQRDTSSETPSRRAWSRPLRTGAGRAPRPTWATAPTR